MDLTKKTPREYRGKTYLTWHGAPFDRGSADSYYDRAFDPHWWPAGTGKGQRVEAAYMSAEELDAYRAGYEQNEEWNNKKEW